MSEEKNRKMGRIALIAVMVVLTASSFAVVSGLVKVGYISGTVTVNEPITFTPSTFTMAMYPGESKIQNITITNHGASVMTVSLSSTVTPASNPPGLTISFNSATYTIQPYSEIVAQATITAQTVGSYSTTFTVNHS